MKALIPDYSEIDKIFIVSPIGVRDSLWDEFQNFLSTILSIIKKKNKGQKIVIVCNSEKDKEETLTKLECNKENIEFFICRVSDIWIRDYFSCGNFKVEDTKEIGTIKALYSPSYNTLAAVDDAAGTILSQKYFDNICTLPFKLDGGNVISNSKYFFISEKLYTENFYLGKPVIDNFLEGNIVQQLVTLPVEILDVVGHTDCILRFLDDKTILLPIYDSDYRVDNRYIMNVKKKLTELLGIEYKFLFIPSYLDDKINDDNIFSAKGLYLNYFRFEDCIIFPSFEGLKDYETEIVRIISKVAPNLSIYFSPCDNIAFEGGCFNCISNVKFKI